jgi:hypothetical protein
MTEVGSSALSAHLFINREQLRRLEMAGVVERLPDGKSFDQDVCRRRYLEYLKSRSGRGSGASTRLLEARERLTQLRIAEREHKLCGVEETNAALTSFAGLTVGALEGLPGGIARARSDRELRAELQAWVTATRTRLADAAEKIADNLEKTGGIGDVWAA